MGERPGPGGARTAEGAATTDTRETAAAGQRSLHDAARAPGSGADPPALAPTAPIEGALDEAMDRYARGDESGFPMLYAGLSGRLRPFLLRLTGSHALADDIVQETFVRIHRARGSFAPGAAVLPWAFAIARNAHRDVLRRAPAVLAPSPSTTRHDAPGPVDPPAGPDANAEEAAIAREAAATVARVLAGLPVAQREAFVLLRYEGMSVGEAARVLGVTQNAVKLRAFRAYEALRAALDVPRAAGTPRKESGNDD